MTVFWLLTAYLAGVATPFVVAVAIYLAVDTIDYPRPLEKEVKS
jgi:hypothetical protein